MIITTELNQYPISELAGRGTQVAGDDFPSLLDDTSIQANKSKDTPRRDVIEDITSRYFYLV